MEPAWRQQGRGRGRGQEGPGERSRPPQKEREAPGRSKFEEIRKSNQAAAQRLVESRVSASSSDEEEDDEEAKVDHKDGKRGKILESTFTTYTNQTGEPRVDALTLSPRL